MKATLVVTLGQTKVLQGRQRLSVREMRLLV